MSLSVAIIRTRYLGDVILLLPLIREIQAADPSARITVIANEGTTYPLDHFPGVRVLPLARGDRFRRWGGTVALATALAGSSFDLLLDLTVSDRSRLLSRLIRAGKKGALGSGGDHRPGDPWDVYRPFDSDSGPRHVTEEQSGLLRTMGLPVSGIHEKSYIPDPAWIDRARSWVLERELSDQPLLVLHPGGRHWFKRWPPDRFARLGSQWVRRTKGAVVVVGSGADRTLVDSVTNGIAEGPVFPLLGAPIGLLDGIIRLARVFVGSDSGPLHMADAAHVPLIGLFGSTLPAVWGPTSSPFRKTLYHRVECSPCRHTGCPEGAMNCLSRITVEEVMGEVEGFL